MIFNLEEVNQAHEKDFERVKKNVHDFRNITHQSEEMCLWVVKKCPGYLSDVKNQTVEICVAALTRDISSIRDIEPKLLGEVLTAMDCLYLPKGPYNTPLLLQKQADGTCLVKQYMYCTNKVGISVEELLKLLVPVEIEPTSPDKPYQEDWNLSVQIQLHFLKRQGLI